MYLTNVHQGDPNLRYVGQPRERVRIFTDTTPPRYPYGALGFKGEGIGSQTKVVGLRIYDIN